MLRRLALLVAVVVTGVTALSTLPAVAQNAAPVAVDDTYVVEAGQTLTVAAPGMLGNDYDPNGDALSLVSLGSLTNGQALASANGEFSYTPDAGFTGTDSFVYTMQDSNGDTNQGTVTIEVQPDPNRSPIAADDTYATYAGQTLTIEAPAILANDYDPDGDAISARSYSSTSNGDINLFGSGKITYTPDAGFTGTDSFSYTMVDENNEDASATVTIEVLPALNRAPNALDDAYTVVAGNTLTIDTPGVLGNDSDPDGDAISARSYSSPSNGDATLFGSGKVTYTPDAGFTGTDSFSYTMTDGNDENASATVTIEVISATQTTPFAQNDTYTTTVDSQLVVEAPGLLDNDRSPTAGNIAVTSYSSPSNGSASGFTDGRLEYTPNAGFTGTDTFSYTLRDGNGNTNSATIRIVVRDPNRDPVALPDVYVAASGQPFTGEAPGLLGNDTDPDGDAISARSYSSTSSGDVTLSQSGEFTYTSDAGFTGTDSFSYTMADGNGRFDNATVTLNVQPSPNRAPVALVDRYSMFQDSTLTIEAPGVLENDYDPDGDGIAARSYSSPSNGDATLFSSGKITYTPDAGFTGTDSFSYTMADGNGEDASATVEIVVASGTALPVELAGLDATADGDRVAVTWQTLGETNNARFEVQRRIETDDPFEVVGTVAGAGTTTEAQEYRFDDVLPFTAERVTYRLKQVDIDGSTEFSPTVVVRRGPGTEVQLVAPFPNPTRQRATVRYVVPEGAAQPVRLNVYNLLGQEVATLVHETQDPGREEVMLDASRWASGTYFLRLQVGEKMRTERVTVVR